MKIIHLASFNGNVGDMINHIGFYNNIRTEVYLKTYIWYKL